VPKIFTTVSFLNPHIKDTDIKKMSRHIHEHDPEALTNLMEIKV